MNGTKRTFGKFVFALFVLVIALAVIKNPANTGNAVGNVWQWLNDAAAGVGSFVTSVFG
ncbi:hypothetical protein [Prauserella rugosa]|uniref:Uncharacterized protein n=1 Tax=Prauserella rugosa TaxID=43354 RepID=A0A660C4S4_9PSEU|nr:hypothetical protein [Prauserella rugosa]TWH18540.1 hypothetical protein JD82_00358 [Prauserella rugosa]